MERSRGLQYILHTVYCTVQYSSMWSVTSTRLVHGADLVETRWLVNVIEDLWLELK